MRRKRWKLLRQRCLMFMRRTHQYPMPRFRFRHEEELTFAVEVGGLCSEHRLQNERGIILQ